MRKVGVIVLVGYVLFGTAGGVWAADAPEGVTAACTPDRVVAEFFEALRGGEAAAAVALFHTTDAVQHNAVRSYVEAGVRFFKTTQVITRTLEVFVVGPFAICALEQGSAQTPGRYDLQMGCLVLVDDCWRLLPQPQNYLAPVNGLSAQEISTFNILQNRFAGFKRQYREYRANNSR